MYFFTEDNIYIFLIQIFLLLGLSKLLAEVFRKYKQPALTAEIIVGILLGPTIFGRFLPNLFSIVFPENLVQQHMLETVVWLGLLFFLLETGLKMDFSIAWRQKGDAFRIAIIDIVVPMVIAFIFAMFLPQQYLIDPKQRLIFAFFMATAMTISAMPVAIRALSDLDLTKTDLGFLIISCLSINEVIGWMLFTAILGFVTQVNVEIVKIVISLFIAILFLVFCLTAGRRFTNFIISRIRLAGLPEPGSSLTFICLLGFFCGAVFQKIGLHALLGFFVAGVMAGEAKALPERTRQVISQMVYAIFIPLFFTGIGLRLDFFKNFNIFLVASIATISIGSKFLGAWIGAKFTKLSISNRLPVAIVHTAGGSMEIVLGILALQYNLISEPIFVAIVFSGLLSALILGPWLRYSITRRKEISILEFFTRKNIILDTKATEKNSLLYEACSIAAEQENMPNTEAMYEAVLQRENSFGTAIEEGIAVPHARFASLIKPVVVFVRPTIGIDWNSPDGKSTHFIFLILTPQDDDLAQVQILRIIAKTMNSPKLREDLFKAKDNYAAWHILEQVFTQYHILKEK